MSYTTGTTHRTGRLIAQTPTVDQVQRGLALPSTTTDYVSPSAVQPASSPTPTPSPTATATATTTPEPSPPGSFPDATDTGVPSMVQLSPYAGPSTITTDGTVIDGKTLGCVEVRASNVVIRNSRISCANPTPDVVANYDGGFPNATVLLEDDEIDCQGGPGTALGDKGITGHRLNIWGCENGGDLNRDIVVSDSYVHDLWWDGNSHTDGFQTSAHLDSAGHVVPGTLNVTLRHNTILANPIDATNASIITYPASDSNLVIAGNLMGGGTYTLYCPSGSGNTGVQVTDNHFTTRFGPKVGFYGPGTGCDPSRYVVTGNVIDETGQPVDLR